MEATIRFHIGESYGVIPDQVLRLEGILGVIMSNRKYRTSRSENIDDFLTTGLCAGSAEANVNGAKMVGIHPIALVPLHNLFLLKNRTQKDDEFYEAKANPMRRNIQLQERYEMINASGGTISC
jgi:hypothetical protein